MKLLTPFVLALLAASPALAGELSPTELGSCTIPMPAGSKVASQVEDTLENGNVTLESGSTQTNVVWFPGANAELTEDTLKLYTGALADSGAWFGMDEVRWTTVEGEAAAVVPIKIGGEEQPQAGALLLWASTATGRYFMVIATPKRSGVDIGPTVDGIAAGIDCSGAGQVKVPLAVIDPVPHHWVEDTAGLPRILYARKDRKQHLLLWSDRTPTSKYSCEELAAPNLERFAQARELAIEGDLRVEVDDADGAAGGDVLCRVVGDAPAWSEADGDLISFAQWPCPNAPERIVSALDVVAGDLGEKRLDPMTGVTCLEDLPERTAAAEPEPEEDDEPKTQFVPKEPEPKKKKKKKK